MSLDNHTQRRYTQHDTLEKRKLEKKKALMEEAEAAKDESKAQIALNQS